MSKEATPHSQLTQQPAWCNWLAVSGALAVSAAAVVVRWMGLDDLNYWFDESFTIRMSQFDFQDIITRSSRDTHPPLSFILLKGWVGLFGDGHLGARSFSVFWGILAVLCAYGFIYEAVFTQTGERFRSVFSAVVGAGCVALSPLQITWSQQVRMYAAVACLSILTTWLLWRAFQMPSSRRRWLLFGIVEFAGLYTHVTMLFVFLGHAIGGSLFLGLQQRKSDRCRPAAIAFLSTMTAVGLFLLPWLIVIKTQHSRVQDDFWIMPLTAEMFWEAIVKCFTVYQRPVEDSTIGIWIAQGLVLTAAFVAIGRRSLHLLTTTAAVVPIASLVILSLIDVNLVNARYFIAGHAMLCVVAGVAISRLPSHWLRAAAAAPLLITLGYFCRDYHDWRQEHAGHSGIPALLNAFRENRSSEEPLIICNPMFYTTARIYSDDSLPLYVSGRLQDYPFFVGTAIMSEHEFKNAQDIDQLDCVTVWVCDYGDRKRFINPVSLSENWKLTTETSESDYSGKFFLRRYDRMSIDKEITASLHEVEP